MRYKKKKTAVFIDTLAQFFCASKCNDVIFKVKFPFWTNILTTWSYVDTFFGFVALLHLLACDFVHAYTIFTHNSTDDGHKPFIFHKKWNQTICIHRSVTEHQIFSAIPIELFVYPSNCFIYFIFQSHQRKCILCVVLIVYADSDSLLSNVYHLQRFVLCVCILH